MTNREHLDMWNQKPHHTWFEHYVDYRYWSNGRIASAILATIAWLSE